MRTVEIFTLAEKLHELLFNDDDRNGLQIEIIDFSGFKDR